MGRIRPAWYYQRQAQEAQARQNYFANRVPPQNATIESRGQSTELYYRSMILLEGTDHLIFKVSVSNDNLALLPAADAGLLTTLGAGETAQRIRGSGLKPTKIHWYRGTATPSRRRTDWGTSVARYYDTQGGRSHYSMPFSRATGNFNPDDLRDQFNVLFNSTNGTRRTLLGAANGRAYVEWEQVTTSAQS
jgi:hypothetical protein